MAIKVVPDAALDPALFARFEVERAALERTEHPGIARILDAGRTDAGLPFLVLDFVEGPTITAYCERRALAVEDRVRVVRPGGCAARRLLALYAPDHRRTRTADALLVEIAARVAGVSGR